MSHTIPLYLFMKNASQYFIEKLVLFINLVMVFYATFNNISLYRSGKFYWWRKLGYPKKIPDLQQVTDNFITQSCIEYPSLGVGIELIHNLRDDIFYR